MELEIEERIVKEVGVAWRKDTVSSLVNAMVEFAKDWTKAE